MAIYDVTEIDSLEHNGVFNGYNSLLKIDATHFILACAGPGYDGYIKTFSIDSSYDNITQIDSIEHDTAVGTNNSIVMLDSTHFALAYSGTGGGVLKVFSIDAAYDTITQISSMVVSSTGSSMSLISIDSTHLILAYTGVSTKGYVETFVIDGSYNITSIDSLEHDAARNFRNSLVQIDSTHFMLAYAGYGDDGFIKTFSIDGSYSTITQIDSVEHDTVSGLDNSLVKLDPTHFMLGYTGGATHVVGVVKTFSIDSFYDITEINSVNHSTIGRMASMITIDSTHTMLAYTGSSDDGFISVFSVDAAYDITKRSEQEHDISYGTYSSLVSIDSTHGILAYTGPGYDGFIKTFVYTAAAAPGWSGSVNGVSSPASVIGVASVNIASVSGVT